MAKKKEVVDDGHRMGKFCGYEQLPNGDLRVAPTYIYQMTAIMTEEQSLNDTAAAFTLALQKLYKPLVERRRKLFETMAEDYGIDLAGNELSLNTQTSVLTATPKGPAPGKSGDST